MKKIQPSAISAGPASNQPLRRNSLALAIAAALSAPVPLYAQNLPTGLQTLSGSVTVTTPTASSMNLNQASQNANMSAQTFSIGFNNRVDIAQPGASSILMVNVVGNNPSNIFGTLTANGQFWLVNTAGVLFGPTASVNVGGLVASTLPISFSDATSGRYVFSKSGSAGSVVNQGNITALNGYVGLFAPKVANEGLIVARMGSVALAAGNQITLDMVGDGLIKVAVNEAALNASALNKGTIEVDGGDVLLTARSANALLDTVINTDGVIRANSIGNRNGTITLDGGDAGVVSVSGQLEAKGINPGTLGGTVKVLGQYVGVGLNGDAATINASGDAGGGTVLIGGNFQGKGPEQNALRTFVGSNASISADAVTAGNGGKVIVWADDTTRYYGSISARGGAQGGDGGFAEVSGKNHLVFDGKADLSSVSGKAGTLLLDPLSIQIINNGTETDLVGAVGDDGNANIYAFAEDPALAATLDADVITGLLNAGTSVTLQAINTIAVDEAITAGVGSNGQGLTLQSGGNTTVNQPITLRGGTISITTHTGTVPANGSIILNAALDTTGGAQTGGVVTLSTNGGAGNIQLGSNITTGNADIQFTGPVALTAGSALDTGAGAGDITFSNTLNGTQTLGLTAGTGSIAFNGIVGTTRLGAVTVNSANNVGINENFNAASFTQTAGTGTTTIATTKTLDVNGAGGVSITTAAASLGGINASAGAVSVTTSAGSIAIGADSVVGNTNVTLTANGASSDVTLAAGGAITGTTGSVSLSAGRTISLADVVTANTTASLISDNDGSGPGAAAGTVSFTGAGAASSGTGTTLRFNPAGYINTASEITAYVGNVTGALDARAWTFVDNASALAENRNYNGTTTATLNTPFTFLMGPDGVTAGQIVALNPGAANFNSANVGATTVNFTGYGVSGTDNGSYALFAQPTSQAQTINPAPVSFTGTRNYDATLNFAAATFGTAGTITTGVGVENLVLTGTGTVPLTGVAAGLQTVNPAGLTLTDGTGLASNYTFTAGTQTATVTQKALTAVALTGAVTKVYDGNNTVANLTTGNYNITGFVGAEGATIGVSTGTYDNGKDVVNNPAGSPVTSAVLAAGNYIQNGGTLLSNYDLTAVTGVSATGNIGEITPRALTAVALTGAVTKIYDGNNTVSNLTTGNYNITGFVAGEGATIAVTTGTYDAGKNVQGPGSAVTSASLVAGDYTQNVGTLLTNYNLAAVTGAPATGPIGQITRLASVSAIAGGNWSSAATWAGGAIPDMANVANVNLGGFTVVLDAGVAQLAGSVQVDNVTGAGASNLNVIANVLNVAQSVTVASFTQNAGTVGITNNLTVGPAGPMNKTGGTLTVGGATTINSPGNPITMLGSNDFTGAVSLAGTTTQISDDNALILGASNIGGPLTVTTTNGAITQSGAMTVAGAASFTSGAALINLSNGANDFQAGVTASSSTGGVSFADANSFIPTNIGAGTGLITLAPSGTLGAGTLSTSGTAILTSNGNVTGLILDIPNAGVAPVNRVNLLGSATQWIMSGSIPSVGASFGAGAGVGVTINGVNVQAGAIQLLSQSAISAAQASAVAAAADEAANTFGTDSVAEQIEYGFAGDVGTLPPIDHRLQGVGISVPKCFNESREGDAC